MKITKKNYITEFVNQKVTHMDGTEGVIQRERVTGSYTTEIEVDVIFGGKDLGYGYEEDGMYYFSGISSNSLSHCKKYASKMNLPAWDANLN